MNAAAAVIQAAMALLSAAPACADSIAEGDAPALPLQFATSILLRSENLSIQPDMAQEGAMASVDLIVELRQRGPNNQSSAIAIDSLLCAAHARLVSDRSLGIPGASLLVADDFVNFETDKGGEDYLHTATLRYQVHASINLLTLELES